MNKFFLFISLLLYLPLFSQEHYKSHLFDSEVKRRAAEYIREINFQKAQLFFLKNNWDSTLIYSMKQLSSGHNNPELADYCHFFRGTSFKQKQLLHEAEKEFHFVSGNFQFYYKVLISLGEISLALKDYEKSLNSFLEIEKLKENTSYDFKRSAVYHNLGICYLHLGKYLLAEDYLLKSYELQQLENDTLLLIGSSMDIASLYYEQYKDHQAIPYFQKAYHLSKKVKDFQIKQNAALNMAVVEENRKAFLLALVYRKEYEQWKDSLNDQNKVWAIAELEKKTAVKLKDNEITLLEAENKARIAQRNGFLVSSVLLFVLFAAGVYFYRQKSRVNGIILAQKKELDELNATKDKLFSVVSHDLRSSVNALKTSNAKLAQNLSSRGNTSLDKLLRNNSSIANGAYNLLDNLLNWAMLQTKQLYFHKEPFHLFSVIQQIEYNYKPLMADKNLSFINSVPKNIFVIADLDSMKIILRNLLDNAIKFSESDGSISVYTRASSDSYCHLVVEDTGIGMSQKMQEEILKETVLLTKKKNDEGIGTGLGTQLCKLMIKKNDGKLFIESQENVGTKMIVLLPKTDQYG